MHSANAIKKNCSSTIVLENVYANAIEIFFYRFSALAYCAIYVSTLTDVLSTGTVIDRKLHCCTDYNMWLLHGFNITSELLYFTH